MALLEDSPGLNETDIAARLQLCRSRVGEIMRLLEKEGLVRSELEDRVSGSGGRRKVYHLAAV